MHQDHPWQSAKDQFDGETLPLLTKHGSRIAMKAYVGDELSSRIVKNYQMLHHSFDPMIHILLVEDLREWIKRYTL
jgi:hypothetical protein